MQSMNLTNVVEGDKRGKWGDRELIPSMVSCFQKSSRKRHLYKKPTHNADPASHGHAWTFPCKEMSVREIELAEGWVEASWIFFLSETKLKGKCECAFDRVSEEFLVLSMEELEWVAYTFSLKMCLQE